MSTYYATSYIFNLPTLTAGNKLAFIVVGDWGSKSATQGSRARNVAISMSQWAQAHGCHFILSTGDNFYPWGMTVPPYANKQQHIDSFLKVKVKSSG